MNTRILDHCYLSFLLLTLIVRVLGSVGIIGKGLSFVGNSGACKSIYVRWPRVKLNVKASRQSALTLAACRNACTNDQDPIKGATGEQCAAINHRPGVNAYTHDCQIFQKDNVQHTDGYVEADDRYTFYWKYCVETEKTCAGDYAFTYLSDRYMAGSEVARTSFTRSLEECLGECLNEGQLLCRSVSFNRTDGGCHVSEQNQLSKPGSIRINNNPNYRIDYYENNCFNNSFTFTPICEEKGIRIRVDSKIPYTGALYGLYDFFSCRVEPRESKKFEYLFPYPSIAKNCSDSMRHSDSDIMLEVVLSTDGIEPLYFITSDDLTYQAKCPAPKDTSGDNDKKKSEQKKAGTSVQQILDALAAGEKHLKEFETDHRKPPDEKTTTYSKWDQLSSSSSSSNPTTQKQFTKDVFTLPPYTPAPQKSSSTTTTESSTTTELTTTTEQTTTTSTTTEQSTTSTTSVTTTETTKSAENDQDFTKTTTKRQPTTIIAVQRKVKASGEEPPTTISAVQKWTTEDDEFIKSRSHGLEAIMDMNRFLRPEPRKKVVSTSPPESATLTTSRATSAETSASATTTKRSVSTSAYDEPSTPESSSKSKPSEAESLEKQHDDFSRYPTTRQGNNFSFSTHLSFPTDRILMSTGSGHGLTNIDHDQADRLQKSTSRKDPVTTTPTTTPTTTTTSTTPSTTTTTTPSTTTTTEATTTTSTTATTTTTSAPEAPQPTKGLRGLAETGEAVDESGGKPPGSMSRGGGSPKRPNEKVIFDIFHNGQPAEAVVVGSRITLSFTPYYAIPPVYMSISGCQVEPIGSLYEWEKEPLAIIKDGCQADHVGLVCPPQRTDYGIRVTVESFRYQTTTQVQYTCLIRVCPFAPCPQTTCPAVDGCPGGDIVSRSLGLEKRAKREELSLEQIRAALAANPYLQQQLGLGPAPAAPPLNALPVGGGLPNSNSMPSSFRMNNSLQQQLIMLGGDTIVRRRLIVVNSEEELRYYVKTGEVPRGHIRR